VAQDARYALRGFRRNPAFTITVIATLALGIGATTAVFSVVDRILFRSLPYAHDDRLVSFGLVQSLEKQEFTLGAFFYEWRDSQRPFAAVTFERGVSTCNLTETNPVHLSCADVAQNFLPTLGISPVLGRRGQCGGRELAGMFPKKVQCVLIKKCKSVRKARGRLRLYQ
jgi:hypothetical protein